MSTRGRLLVFAAGAVVLVIALLVALTRIPGFGSDFHPYGGAAVAIATRQHTANAVSSINFDQRGLDTVGEEAILVAAVVGAATLLRRTGSPRLRPPRAAVTASTRPPLLAATRLAGYVLLPVTLLLGVDVVVHGHLTPGGGFQGGVVLATGLHLLYVAGDYRALRRVRPLVWYEAGEAVGMAAVLALGVAGLAAGTGFLSNFLPKGSSGQLFSAGTVALFSCAVGIAVGSGIVVLLAQFLDEYLGADERAT